MARINHDRLFKELLTTFFVEFLELFFPELVEYLEADSLEFIDKEIFTDITAGERREADLLVKCRFQGRETFFLIHLEHQSKREKAFARRMFLYFARLSEKYALPVYPIAVFSYDKPKTLEENQYVVSFADKKVVEFNFAVIQLNRLNWRDFLTSNNPIASALMAKMGIAPEDRVTAKKECLRMIARLKLDSARTHLLGGFVDMYLKLLEKERKKFERELQKLPMQEREEVMELRTTWEEDGIKIGFQKGKQEGLTTIILRLLKKRFGTIDEPTESKLSKLSVKKLEELSESLLDFKDINDVKIWLKQTLGK